MTVFNFNLDLSGFVEVSEKLIPAVQKALTDAAAALTADTHAHIVQNAQKKMHSSKRDYVNALSFEQVNNDTWIIQLDRKMRWREDGQEPHSQVEDLLKSRKTRPCKDGSRVLSVPFEHNKGPAEATSAQTDLASTIKSFLRNQNKGKPKDQKILYGSIEKNSDGTPKLGLLHKFDIKTAPIKTQEGPGQGRGSIGSVRKGWPKPGGGQDSGTPLLQGIRIYQKQVKDKKGKEHLVRSIMTFRTVSSKHMGTQKWFHPGTPPLFLFEEAASWALNEWETKVKDQVLAEIASQV